jgi:hypothetical protein
MIGSARLRGADRRAHSWAMGIGHGRVPAQLRRI